MNLFSGDKIYSPNDTICGYTVIRLMGEGRYGICYLVCKDDKKFILKQLKKRMLRKVGVARVFEEEILLSIEHPSIPGLIRSFSAGKVSGYLLEYKEGKTFEEIIYKDRQIFGREEIYSVGLQLVQILKYLHAKRVVHRDIRVPNTLYNEGKVYLVDFGLARWIGDDNYTADVDFSFLGDFLLHLYYSSYEIINLKSRPWYDELTLTGAERLVLKRLLGIERRYETIDEVENAFLLLEQNTLRSGPSL
jgi:serine/threonine-protein kinase